MNSQDIKQILKQLSFIKFHHCNGPVADCPMATLWVKEPNKFQPWKFGEYKYVPVCSESYRRGVSKTTLPDGIESSSVISEDQRKELQRNRDEKADAHYKEMSRLTDELNKVENEEGLVFYKQHLTSDYWRSIRAKVLQRDNHVCRGCLVNRATQVHHTTYQNLGAEFAFELVSVCNDCHARLHPETEHHEG